MAGRPAGHGLGRSGKGAGSPRQARPEVGPRWARPVAAVPARATKDDQAQDVDKLTHEDEEKWFEGTEESSPQVWQ